MINVKSFTLAVVNNALKLHVTLISPKIVDRSVIYSLYKFNIIKGIKYENNRYFLKINLNLGRRVSIKNWWRSNSRIRLS